MHKEGLDRFEAEPFLSRLSALLPSAAAVSSLSRGGFRAGDQEIKAELKRASRRTDRALFLALEADEQTGWLFVSALWLADREM